MARRYADVTPDWHAMTWTRANGPAITDWPEIDRSRWLAEFGPRIVGLSPWHRWRPPTKAATAKGYGRWLGWLFATGQINSVVDPAERIDDVKLCQYIDYLQEHYRPASVVHFLVQFSQALRVVAPSYDRAALKQAIRALPKRGDVERKRGRLQPVEKLIQQGFHLMELADQGWAKGARRNAVVFRDGLLLAWAAYLPVRPKNHRETELTKNEVVRGRLTFGPTEMKNKKYFSLHIPKELQPHLARYLAVHRPLLCNGEYNGDALWVSFCARPLSAEGLYRSIARTTRSAFGKAINPHLFRDCVATSIALNTPHNIDVAAKVLGNNFATMQEAYNQATGADASRRYQKELKKLKRRRVRRG